MKIRAVRPNSGQIRNSNSRTPAGTSSTLKITSSPEPAAVRREKLAPDESPNSPISSRAPASSHGSTLRSTTNFPSIIAPMPRTMSTGSSRCRHPVAVKVKTAPAAETAGAATRASRCD